eukprot:5632609-Prymnesium_polylepis.1
MRLAGIACRNWKLGQSHLTSRSCGILANASASLMQASALMRLEAKLRAQREARSKTWSSKYGTCLDREAETGVYHMLYMATHLMLVRLRCCIAAQSALIASSVKVPRLSSSIPQIWRVFAALLGNSLDARQAALWHRRAQRVDRVEREGALAIHVHAADLVVAQTVQAQSLHIRKAPNQETETGGYCLLHLEAGAGSLDFTQLWHLGERLGELDASLGVDAAGVQAASNRRRVQKMCTYK